MKAITTVLLMVLCQISYLVYGQTTGGKIENIGNQVENIAGTIDAIKGLFSKKTNKASVRNVSGLLFAGLYTPGTITKTTKYISCDHIESFNKGAALIRNGTQYALIDKDANFIVPYGKFTGLSTELTNFSEKFPKSGFFYATYFENNTEKRCIINAKGTIVKILGDDGLLNFDISPEKDFLIYSVPKFRGGAVKGYLELTDFGGKTYRITKENSWQSSDNGFRDSMLVFSEYVNNKLLFGFKDLNDKLILKATYAFMQPFSDGVAIIGQYNSLNQLRYGIIDKTGKLLVQPSYENKPSRFTSGLASIRANDGATAYINKNGKVLYKSSQRFSWIKNGRVFENKTIIDTSLKTIDVLSFSRQFGIAFRPNSNEESYTVFQQNGYANNNNQMKVYVRSSTGNFTGTYFFDTGTMFTGADDWQANYYKDNVSNLVHVKVQSGKNMTEGYVNAIGDFVIIKKPTQNAGL